MRAFSPHLPPARRPAASYGYLTINGQRGSQTVDEGDEVTFEFVESASFPDDPVDSWELYKNGELVDGESGGPFAEYVISSASESDAGTWRLELTVGGKVVRASAVLGVTPSVYDADALDYYSRAEALGGSFDQSGINALYTESYIKTAISDFVAGCKTDSIWDKLTEIYLLSHVSFGGLLAKLKHAGTATLTNNNFVSGDYLAVGSGAGLKGNGSTKRLESDVIVNTFMSASSGSLGVYAAEFETTGEPGHIGVADVLSVSAPHAVLVGAKGVIANAFSAYSIAASSQPASAFKVVSRTSTTSSIYYLNGVQSGSTNTTLATSVPAGSIGVYSNRYGTGTGSYTHSVFTSMRARFAFVGLGLDATAAANLSTRVNALMTAIGANVY